jgi:Zn-dependent M28 family amino/carboxypeptidase
VSANYQNPLTEGGKKLEKEGAHMITATGIHDDLERLVSFGTRSFQNDEASKEVEDHLLAKFEKMKLKTCLHHFSKNGRKLANVIAFQAGSGDAKDSVTVGAHYDSRPFTGQAPGADDNGSGVAALLAIAKAFTATKAQTEKNVYFVGFAGEEDGLDGSAAYTKALFEGGLPEECEDLYSHGSSSTAEFLGKPSSVLQTGRRAQTAETHRAIVLDEVGWKSPGKKLAMNIESYDWADDVMDNVAQASRDINGDAMDIIHSNNPFGSDHMSFLDRHIQGALMINQDDESYPNYHKSSDTIDKVSTDYVAMIAKASFGGLMRLAKA